MVKRIILAVVIIILFYLSALLFGGIYINQHKDEIQTYVARLFEEKLAGTATIRDIDVSVWKNFPLVTITATGFTLTDSVYHLPVLSAGAVSSTFNIFQVLFSGKTIRNISVEHGLLHIFTDSTGFTNEYLLALKNKMTTGAASPVAGQLNIDQLSVRDLTIIIEDKIKAKEISMHVRRLTSSISQSGSLVHIRMQEDVLMKKGLGFNLVKGAYLENETIEAKWNLLYDTDIKRLSFGNTKVAIGAHPFELEGYFIFDKTNPAFSIALNTKKLAYADAKNILTSAIRQKLDRYNLQHPLDVYGTIAGSLLPARDPVVDIFASTKDNNLHTLFADFSHCSFSGSFINQVDTAKEPADANSAIKFEGFNADWDGIPVEAKAMAISQLDSPYLKLQAHADANLQALDNKLALKEMAFEKGHAIFDLLYDGPLVDGSPSIEKVQGTIAIQNGSVNYLPRSFNFENCNGVIILFKDSISMRGFTCSYKKNKFTVNLDGSNIRGKLMGTGTTGQSVINCLVKSPSVDLADFTGLFGDRKSRTKTISSAKQFGVLSRSLDTFIGNSVIDIFMQAGSVKNQGLSATNFDTHIRFEPNSWTLSHIGMNLAGGNISATGKVNGVGGVHTAAFKVRMDNVDMKKLLYAFDDFGQDAVTHDNLSGNFMTVADLKVGISAAGHIIPHSIYGSIDFSLKDGILQQFTPFNRLKTFVFKKRNLDNVKFAEIKDRFDINGESVYIGRMELRSTAFRIFVEGNYGFYNKNTDLLIQVPFSNLNGNGFSDDSTLANKGVGNRKAGNIWLRAVNDDDGKIKVKLTLNRKVLVSKGD